MISLELHLISDSTCETTMIVARSAVGHFPSLEVKEFVWSLTNSTERIDEIMLKVKKSSKPFVMYTIANYTLRHYLEQRCEDLEVPCIPVLEYFVNKISSYIKILPNYNAETKPNLDEEYFRRIDAINYTLSHDDGQNVWDVLGADIIIIGVSRTSKSPTSIYLSYRGYKVANLPFVHLAPLPISFESLAGKFVVGFTINPQRLIEIRRNRLVAMNTPGDKLYVDYNLVCQEIEGVRRLCIQHRWPIIEVTQRSIEEIAATIIQMHSKFKNKVGIN